MDHEASHVASDGITPGFSPVDLACASCHADLNRLPVIARFCPRCGAARRAAPCEPPEGGTQDVIRTAAAAPVAPPPPAVLHQAPVAGSVATAAPPPLGAVPPIADVAPSLDLVEQRLAEWDRLRQAVLATAPTGGPAGPHSQVIHGYANAMFRLGWRYESGHGASRNGGEAVRCYLKAARLGNAAALGRLAPRCTTDTGVAPLPVLPLDVALTAGHPSIG